MVRKVYWFWCWGLEEPLTLHLRSDQRAIYLSRCAQKYYKVWRRTLYSAWVTPIEDLLLYQSKYFVRTAPCRSNVVWRMNSLLFGWRNIMVIANCCNFKFEFNTKRPGARRAQGQSTYWSESFTAAMLFRKYQIRLYLTSNEPLRPLSARNGNSLC